MFKIIFFGTPEIALPTLEYLFRSHHLLAVVTMPDKPRERGGANTMTPVKKRALELNIPVFEPQTPKDEIFIESMKRLEPDLFVVFAYGHILKKTLLDVPRLGPINLHTSILPSYRGAAPIERAIMANERTTGVSVMQMDIGMDTGAVYLVKKVEISPEMDATMLSEKLSKTAPEALQEVLEQIYQNRAVLYAQNHALATYAPKIQKEELELLCEEKEKMVLRIRALTGYGGAKILLPNNQLLKVFKAQAADRYLEKPLEIHGGSIFFHALNGSIELLEVQLQGKKRMHFKEFLNGYRNYIK